MATVTVFTAERMQEIEDASIETVAVVGNTIVLTTHDATEFVLGPLIMAPQPPPSVTGSRGGNAALASLLTELDTLGIIEDNTTA